MASPRSFTASSSTSARARSAWLKQSCAIGPFELQVITRCRIALCWSSARSSSATPSGLSPGARKRNPEIFLARAMELFEFGQQGRAGNWPNFATPSPPEQRSQRSSRVIRGARAHQVYGRGRGITAADSGTPENIVQFGVRSWQSYRSCPRYWAAARFRGAYAPARARIFPAPANPIAYATRRPRLISLLQRYCSLLQLTRRLKAFERKGKKSHRDQSKRVALF